MNDLIGYHASCPDRLLPFVKDRSGSCPVSGRCSYLHLAAGGQVRSFDPSKYPPASRRSHRD
jgi:hypothetical protein